MARISFAAHPFLLGCEQIDRLLEKTIKSSNALYIWDVYYIHNYVVIRHATTNRYLGVSLRHGNVIGMSRTEQNSPLYSTRWNVE